MESIFSKARERAQESCVYPHQEEHGNPFPGSYACQWSSDLYHRISDGGVAAGVTPATQPSAHIPTFQTAAEPYHSADSSVHRVLLRLDDQVERWKRQILDVRSPALSSSTSSTMHGMNEEQVRTEIMYNTDRASTRVAPTPTKERRTFEKEVMPTGKHSGPEYNLRSKEIETIREEHEQRASAYEKSLAIERLRVEQLQHELSQVVQAYQSAVQRAEWAEGIVLQRHSTPSGSRDTKTTTDGTGDDLDNTHSVKEVESSPPVREWEDGNNITHEATKESKNTVTGFGGTSEKSPSPPVPHSFDSPLPCVPMPPLALAPGSPPIIAEGCATGNTSVGTKNGEVKSPSGVSVASVIVRKGPPIGVTQSLESMERQGSDSTSSPRSSIVVVRKKKPPNLE